MADGDISTQAEAQSLAGVGVADDFDLAAEVTNHADKVLKASGSALKHYTMPSAKRAILSAMMDAMEAAYRAGANFAERLYEDRFTRLTEANAAQARRWSLIDQLRDGEGHSVEIIHDNPDFGGPNCSVRTTTDYGMNYAVFFGETVDACLEAAVAARALTGGPHD